MELTTILFYVFGLLTVGAAAVMVFSNNIVHSAFALMFSLIGIASLYVLLYADFVAATQLLVYVGGILVLILFGVMLTSQRPESMVFKTVTVNLLPASLLSLAVAVILIGVFSSSTWNVVDSQPAEDTVYDLGMSLMSHYVLPFIVIGVLLLIAIIGAILMSTKTNIKTSKES